MVLSEKYHKNAIKILIREWYFCGTLPKVPLNFVVQKYHKSTIRNIIVYNIIICFQVIIIICICLLVIEDILPYVLDPCARGSVAGTTRDPVAGGRARVMRSIDTVALGARRSVWHLAVGAEVEGAGTTRRSREYKSSPRGDRITHRSLRSRRSCRRRRRRKQPISASCRA